MARPLTWARYRLDRMDGIETAQRRKPALVYPLGDAAPGLAETIEIAPGIHWVRMPLPFALKHINVWLVDDGDAWTIIDTGIPLPETKDAWRRLLESRVTQAKPLRRVIVTHMHPDHVGSAGWLCHKYGAELWMSRLEYITCRMLVSDTGRPAPEAGISFYRRAGWSDSALGYYKTRFGGFGRGVSPMPDAFKRLSDGDALRLAGQAWTVIVGSGHSPEHACLYCPSLNLIISGDQLLPRISSNVSVHPTEAEANPLRDWIQSCEKLLARLPPDVLVLPAHNEPFRGAHERLRHLIDGHRTALQRLRQRLEKEPLRAIDTFVTLFGRKVADDELGMATGEAIAHLNYLHAESAIEATTGPDGVVRYSAAPVM